MAAGAAEILILQARGLSKRNSVYGTNYRQPETQRNGKMWVSQTYVGSIDLPSDIFIYYFWEDYAGQLDIPPELHNRLAELGYRFGDSVSVFVPMKSYLGHISQEMEKKFRKFWWEFQHKTPGLFICYKPLSKFDPNEDEYLYLPLPENFGRDPAQAESFLRDLYEKCRLVVGQGRPQTPPSKADSGILKVLYDGIQLKPSFMGFGLDLKPILSNLARRRRVRNS